MFKLILLFLLLPQLCFAAQGYKTKSNPFTGKLDYIIDVSDIQAVDVTASGTVSGVTIIQSGLPITGMTYPDSGIPLSTGSAWGTSITNNSTNWDTAYTHSQDNTQAHSDYVLNTGADTLGAGAGFALTFDASAGTDVTFTFGDNLVTVAGNLTLSTGKNFTLGTTQWNSGDSIDGTKVANADLGDIGVSSGVWSVEDSSHAHSAATITEADPLALLTAGTDNVKDTHIDWGTGASQVSPADFANQDIGDITITTGDWAVEDDSHAHVITNIDAFTSAALYGQVSDETGSASGTPLLVFNQNPTINGITMANNNNLTIGTETFTFDGASSNDFELSDDLNINDTDPHLRLVDTTASQDDFEIYADGSRAYFTNYTDAKIYWTISSSDNFKSNEIKSKSFTLIAPIATDDYPLWRVNTDITILAIHVQCTGGTNIVGGLDEYNSAGATIVAAVDSDITSTAGNSVNDDGSLTNGGIASGNYLFWHTTSISGTPTSVTVSFEYVEIPA